MDTKPLERFATRARRELLAAVEAQASTVLAAGSLARSERGESVKRLESEIATHSHKHVMDKVTYTWFNRLIALRYMDARGYSSAGVVSPAQVHEHGQPEILADAKRGHLDTAVVTNTRTREAILSLLDGTRRSADAEGEAYSLLLTEYCRHWNRTMPFMFERKGDYTELLVPSGLLADGAILARARDVLTEEVCQDVEVIGWLYQFYISERKDEVFAGFKKNKKAGADEIPAATQLFTPHWIVRYLVENSLGRLWMLNHPESRLVDRMDYYITPVDEETDFLKIVGPEELTIIDPACGSGHMLTYAFDLLYAIYEEEGYAPSAIPALILSHNLYGTEIDPRAGALAAFALTMKARARQRTFFNSQIEPKICVFERISFSADDLNSLNTKGGDRCAEEAFWNQFAEADTLGSLIQPDPELTALLSGHLKSIDNDGDLLQADLIESAGRTILQAEYLLPRYAVVIANPPYMGVKNMGSALAEFVKKEFPRSKADLFAAFIERVLVLGRSGALTGLVTMHSWMFLSSFEKLRDRLFDVASITNMAHLGTRAFNSIGGAVVATSAFILSNRPRGGAGVFVRLVEGQNEREKLNILKLAARDAGSTLRFERASDWFRNLPGAPISYWLSEGLVRSFVAHRPLSAVASPRQGLATTDNDRFLRRWSEVSSSRIGFGLASRGEAEESNYKWFPYNKGGNTRRWYGNHDFVVNWQDDGREIKQNIIRKYPYLNGNPNFVAKNTGYYFRPSISWSLIGTGAPSFRYYPQGFVFDVAGTSVFPNDIIELEALLGYLNSGVTEALLAAIAPTMNLVGGDIARVPVPDLAENATAVAEIVDRLVALAAEDWDSTEASWEFQRPPVLDLEGSLGERIQRYVETRTIESKEIHSLEATLEQHFSDAVGLEQVPSRGSDFDQGRLSIPEAGEIIAQLVSYAIGCMFGRYSLDEPGLILADQGATLQDYLAKVPSPRFMPDAENVIPIVDGDWFEDDVVERFRQFLRVAFGKAHFEENLRFVEESLGVNTIRDYFVGKSNPSGKSMVKSRFYEDHVQRYKKRPIYWMFSSPKGSFNALIYMHRYTPATVSTVLNEYLREYRAKVEIALQRSEEVVAGGASATELKEAERLRKVLAELRDYEHDVLYPLDIQQIAIDLDDGVKANYPKFYPALRNIKGLEAPDE